MAGMYDKEPVPREVIYRKNMTEAEFAEVVTRLECETAACRAREKARQAEFDAAERRARWVVLFLCLLLLLSFLSDVVTAVQRLFESMH